jgi:hypothetical protein
VTSDIPTLRERLARGGGIAAERRPEALARAIASVLLDGHLAERLGAEGQAIARSCTWADTARRMEAVYAAASASRNDV